MSWFKLVFSELMLYVCNNWINSLPSHSIRLCYYKYVMQFEIGKGSTIFMKTKFNAKSGLVIGAHTIINDNCRVDTRGGILIGNNVSISSDVVLLTADHDPNSDYFQGRSRQVVIEDFVWIGTRAMILPGCKIGKGAVIAAGAVVTTDVAENAIYGGVPARFIKMRTSNLNYELDYFRLFQ